MIRAIDLCSGCGGWACAARGLPIHIETAIDMWEPAAKTYKLNHPRTNVLIRDLRNQSVQDFIAETCAGVDLVLGGIPCEWLSPYRSLTKVGPIELEEQRQTLDCVLALTRRINPRWWCLEDVKELIRQLPPLVPWTEINSRGYSPQRRKRIYVGCFPSPPAGANQEVMRGRLRRGPWRVGRRSFGADLEKLRGFNGSVVQACDQDKKAPTIISVDSRHDRELCIIDRGLPGGIRQMEWQEAAALQGFPDDYLFFGSPTDVAKQIGRAVQIDTAHQILRAIVGEWRRDHEQSDDALSEKIEDFI